MRFDMSYDQVEEEDQGGQGVQRIADCFVVDAPSATHMDIAVPGGPVLLYRPPLQPVCFGCM
jgi:hypothetical protein